MMVIRDIDRVVLPPCFVRLRENAYRWALSCLRGRFAGNASNWWFALDETRPLAFFAGIWTTWEGVRKAREGEVKADHYAFLTTERNTELGAVHPKAMPVILRTEDEIEMWMNAPWDEASTLQLPLPDASLEIVARGVPQDGAE